jgi:hypothetical protein
MNKQEHLKRHLELHAALDELVADWIMHTQSLPSYSTVMDLMSWSHTQTQEDHIVDTSEPDPVDQG